MPTPANDERWRYLHGVVWDALKRCDDIPHDELPDEIISYLESIGAAQPVYFGAAYSRSADVLAALSHVSPPSSSLWE